MAPDNFTEVMKVMNYIGKVGYQARLILSRLDTCQICLYGLDYSLGIHGFRLI